MLLIAYTFTFLIPYLVVNSSIFLLHQIIWVVSIFLKTCLGMSNLFVDTKIQQNRISFLSIGFDNIHQCVNIRPDIPYAQFAPEILFGNLRSFSFGQSQ